MATGVPRWCWVSVLAKASEATATRSLYPYISTLADSMGVTEEAVALCISLKEVSFSLVPLLGPWLRRRYGALAMRIGGGLGVAAAVLAIGLSELFPVFVVAVFVLGGATSMAVSGTQMLVTDHIGREGMGRATAVIEISWGLSSLLGVPLFGLLMSVGWSLPWLVFAAVVVLSCIALRWSLPRRPLSATAVAEAGGRAETDDAEGAATAEPAKAVEGVQQTEATDERGETIEATKEKVETLVPPAAKGEGRGGMRGQLRRYGRVLGTPQGRSVAIGGALLTSVADGLFVSFGVWLEAVHGLDLTSVALASIAVGVADIVAEVALAAAMSPSRLSPPASLTLGWALQLGSYLVLPWLTTATNGVTLSVIAFAFQVTPDVLAVAEYAFLPAEYFPVRQQPHQR